MDREQCDELAGAVDERGDGGDQDRERFAALKGLIGAKGSRRQTLAGLIGAGLLGLGALPAQAERPHQRLQGRTPKRNRKQRNRRRSNGQNEKAARSSPWERNRSGPSKCIQEKLFGVCTQTPFYEPEQDSHPCCNGMECTATAGVLVTACQMYCATDADCKAAFPGKALACRVDALVCPARALKGEKCCVPR